MSETMPIHPDRLKAFFRPQSIALIGATDKSRWSISTFQNLKTFGYPGPIYCVNPNYDVVHGEPAVGRIADIPQPVDLAFVMVPTNRVYSIIEEAAAAGIPNLVVLTSGFSEMGVEGLRLEMQILEFVQRHDMVMLGPNGNGFVNVLTQTMPYGLPISPPLNKGPVGVVLQSGALASAVITLAQTRHIGLSHLVSMGNETMMSATDVMNYLVEDESTRVIAVFLETIRQPELFQQVARKALTYKKPIVALKIGRSAVSARAAKAHTGALVGDDSVNDAMFKQLGIIRVASLEDLLVTAGLLGHYGTLPGRRVGLVTPSGGACDILSDRAHDEGILLPEFAPSTVQGLQGILPAFSTAHNPLDVTGYIVVDRTLQQRALEIVAKDPGIDFVLCLTEPPRVEPQPPLLEPLLEQYDRLGKMVEASPVPVVMMSNTCIDITPFGRTISERAHLHFLAGMEHGMSALGHALWWSEVSKSRSEQRPATSVPATTLSEKPEGTWSEVRARNFLQAHGIPVIPAILATTPEEAEAATRELGFPVAMKIQSSEILHKSDIGGVQLNVSSAEQARQSFASIMHNGLKHTAREYIDGILISPMRPAGIELLVGIIQDAVWGQVLAVAMGGIWVEVFKDSSVRVLPVQREDIKEMLNELHASAILRGTRGQPAADMDALVDVIYRIASLAQELRDYVDALEINPLLIRSSAIEALDVLITWKK